MQAAKSFVVITLAVVAGWFSTAVPTSGQGSKVSRPVSVRDFRQGNVIGYLGHPLGTVVRVTGIGVDGSRLRQKALDGQMMLLVQTVNGRRLEQPVYFRFHRADKKVAKPEDGERFDYYVHEWGAFDGVVTPPKELGIEQPMMAHDGFGYRPQLTIHKSNLVGKLSGNVKQ